MKTLISGGSAPGGNREGRHKRNGTHRRSRRNGQAALRIHVEGSEKTPLPSIAGADLDGDGQDELLISSWGRGVATVEVEILMETTDPLLSPSVQRHFDRAAGCRDLSLMGTVENLETLAALAAMDKSPGVRLNAAAAAAATSFSVSKRGRQSGALGRAATRLRLRLCADQSSGQRGRVSIMACLDRQESADDARWFERPASGCSTGRSGGA